MITFVETAHTPQVVASVINLCKQLERNNMTPILIERHPEIIKEFQKNSIETLCLLDFKSNEVYPTTLARWNFKSRLVYRGISFNDLFEYEACSFSNDQLKQTGADLVIEAADRLSVLDFLIKKIKPNLTFAWSGFATWHLRALRLAAQKRAIPCHFLERGFFPRSLVIDPHGPLERSIFANGQWRVTTPLKRTAEENIIIKKFWGEHVTASLSTLDSQSPLLDSQIRTVLDIASDAKVVLFPIQDNFFLRTSPTHKTLESIIGDILDAIKKIPNSVLIIKNHPEWSRSIYGVATTEKLKQLKSNPVIRLANSENIHSLLAISDAVVTINSNVGLEAILRKKPVVALGASIYTYSELVQQPVSADDFKSQLTQLLIAPHPPRNEKEISDLLYFLTKNYLFFEKEVFPDTNHKLISQIAGYIQNKSWFTAMKKRTFLVTPFNLFRLKSEIPSEHGSVIFFFPKCPPKTTKFISETIKRYSSAISMVLMTSRNLSEFQEVVGFSEKNCYHSFLEVVEKLGNTNRPYFCLVASDDKITLRVFAFYCWLHVLQWWFSSPKIRHRNLPITKGPR